MAYDPKIHRRRSLRLKGYDYTQVGAYFVTIVTQGRLCLFGEIVGKEMRLNEAGEMVCGFWEALPQRFPAIEMDMFVVMPNHLHGIVVIKNRATTRVAPTNQNPDRGVENAPNTPNRTTTTVDHTKLTNVGAGLVPAQNTNSTEYRATTRVAPTDHQLASSSALPDGATTRVAPTNQNPDPDVENAPNTPNRTTTTVDHTKLTNVGAGLVPAQNTNSTEYRATTRVAPTDHQLASPSTLPDRATTRVAPTDHQLASSSALPDRATTRVAPTNQNPDPDVENAPTVPNRATTRVAPTGIMEGGVDAPITDRFALGDVIGAYKSLSTVEYARRVKLVKWAPFHKRLWQRNYYEHVVRHDESLRQLQQYILDNPAQWAFDKENPLAKRLETEKL